MTSYGEPIKTVGLQSAHENRELRIACQGILYGENNHKDGQLLTATSRGEPCYFLLEHSFRGF
jgi:hypothetical protein